MIIFSPVVVSESIPQRDQRRVWVLGIGPGVTIGREMQGSIVLRWRVLLDDGIVAMFAPRQVDLNCHVPMPGENTNVVELRARK